MKNDLLRKRIFLIVAVTFLILFSITAHFYLISLTKPQKKLIYLGAPIYDGSNIIFIEKVDGIIPWNTVYAKIILVSGATSNATIRIYNKNSSYLEYYTISEDYPATAPGIVDANWYFRLGGESYATYQDLHNGNFVLFSKEEVFANVTLYWL